MSITLSLLAALICLSLTCAGLLVNMKEYREKEREL